MLEFCNIFQTNSVQLYKVTVISYCLFVYWLLAVYAYGDALQKALKLFFSLYTAYLLLCNQQNCPSHQVSTLYHLLNQ